MIPRLLVCVGSLGDASTNMGCGRSCLGDVGALVGDHGRLIAAVTASLSWGLVPGNAPDSKCLTFGSGSVCNRSNCQE